MEQGELWRELRALLGEREIGAGVERLEAHRAELRGMDPEEPGSGVAVGCLAQWLDVGFEDGGLVEELVGRFAREGRHRMRLDDYVHLRSAEALLAMRRENLSEALGHVETVLRLGEEVGDARVKAVGNLWKARCLRKAGEYEQALEVTRRGIEVAHGIGLVKMGAVMRTLESWLLFQRGATKEALVLLTEAEAVLRDTDDFITLGNIQSTYGRIAMREGRYDHAMGYFEASIELFKRRPALEGYLARSLTNTAQAKRFAALQLRRAIDARRERGGNGAGRQDKTGQLERMHELLRSAQADLRQAEGIYKRLGNHHGAGNVDVSLANVHLDTGDLYEAERRAAEAFELGATKADYVLMCRARVVQAMVANARFEEEIGEGDDPSRFGQLAHDCAMEAVDLGQRTESRRLLAQAQICLGLAQVNGFFNNTEGARASCDKAESYLDHDRRDALWQEVEILRAKILRAGLEDPNLRAWSQGAVGDKSLQEVVADFEELLIRRVWEHEGKKVSRVAHRLAVSPKKVRRVLRRLGVLGEEQGVEGDAQGRGKAELRY